MRLRSSIAPYFMIKHDQRDRDYSVQSVVAFGAVIGRQLIQNFANPPAQLGNLERLRQKWDSGDPIGVQCLSIACYQQRFESRLAGLRALHNGRAIHFGHGIINEQQVDRPLPFEDLQGKGRIVCLPYGITTIAQERPNERPDVAVVIANQNPSLARAESGAARFQGGSFG